ncbi:MAG: gliding motility-associated C-terminal domain-containing protein [Sphingobacteriales bacterium]|nr:MAG: gliding motility-associated C-terminal domain-containing protein [Sphingobacteriales bacterium]
MRYHKILIVSLLFILTAGKLSASHYYGADLYYTHVAGNTYKVTLVAFGDCSGGQFISFPRRKALIHIRQGSKEILRDFLLLEEPKNGIEVTPVCPAEINNTACKGGTIPGVKKFVYSKEFTLSGAAPDWKFLYFGSTDSAVIAGRSNSLTNVSPAGIITLEATLDNTKEHNSSPVYSTIATPFYCVNRPVNFNPGALDGDGDSLVYELVTGMDSNVAVRYIPGFTPKAPLDVVPGAFGFSTSTGQLAFTPRNTQKSLVVYQVKEYRKGILIGSSMREMTVVVMDCINNPPGGVLSNTVGATQLNSVTVKTCKGSHELVFDINPADADNGHIINMVANGLPKDAKLEITDNNTTRPRSKFVWPMPDLPDGDYTFFVTYTDDGCPIASKQTQAYTIRIAPDTITSQATEAGCRKRGVVTVAVPPAWDSWNYEAFESGKVVHKRTGIGTYITSDSMQPGRYVIKAVNNIGCIAETTAEVPEGCFLADIPTAFSPNGDGSNDILYVMGEGVLEMQLKIYNRWGQVVFESRDLKTGWDGTYNGAEAPMESYAYVLTLVLKNGQSLYKKGNITLIR